MNRSLLVSAFLFISVTALAGVDRKAPKQESFRLKNLEIASLSDSKNSTGATLFFFPRGAYMSFDSRGGSVASTETTLYAEGSYSNYVDGVVFAGGSTLGLGVADGVRTKLYQDRVTGGGPIFDAIPAVPGAVVYDFSYRPEGTDKLAIPSPDLGRALLGALSPTTFLAGRAGAGINTTVNKIGKARWGGQGIASGRITLNNKKVANVVVAVVLNPMGDIVSGEKSLSEAFPEIPTDGLEIAHPPGTNTTLSILMTDYPLDRNALKRLAIMVHTSMGASIQPFNGPTDGDIHFSVSTTKATEVASYKTEFELGSFGGQLMKKAIVTALEASN